MRAFFDTSALVPVFYGDHIHHRRSLDRFLAYSPDTGCCGAHSLAEVYSTLTRMPGKHRVTGRQAMQFIDSIRNQLSIVSLGVDDYSDALEASAALGIVGGAVYDALLVHCARKVEAEIILTWNMRHYGLCGPDVIARLQTP